MGSKSFLQIVQLKIKKVGMVRLHQNSMEVNHKGPQSLEELN